MVFCVPVSVCCQQSPSLNITGTSQFNVFLSLSHLYLEHVVFFVKVVVSVLQVGVDPLQLGDDLDSVVPSPAVQAVAAPCVRYRSIN